MITRWTGQAREEEERKDEREADTKMITIVAEIEEDLDDTDSNTLLLDCSKYLFVENYFYDVLCS